MRGVFTNLSLAGSLLLRRVDRLGLAAEPLRLLHRGSVSTGGLALGWGRLGWKAIVERIHCVVNGGHCRRTMLVVLERD